MHKFTALATLVSALPLMVSAQSPLWGQCGGTGWTGSTTCVAGSGCSKTNEYYSQCIPETSSPVNSSPPSSTSTPLPGNPYAGASVYLSPYYASEVKNATTMISDSTLKAKAASVANIPTFIWLDVVAKVPTLETYLKDAEASKQLLQIVVYDLPDRDCAALASNGEFSVADDGVAKYKNYIDQIATAIAKYPSVTIVAIIEPDSLANLVTNLSRPKCSGAQAAYKEGIAYAIKKLAALNVYMYLDAGHAGWLGWPANLTPAGQLFAQIYQDAGSPKTLRGLATNVANYNALRASSPDPVTPPNPNYDEIHYIEALAPALRSAGWDATFIVDQGRSGRQNIRSAWGNWCNVNGAGFGTHPTTDTGSSLIDAIVWAKPGGESDGTSDPSAVRYDGFCGNSDAFKPSPEAGTWNQDYFVMLVQNANPAL